MTILSRATPAERATRRTEGERAWQLVRESGVKRRYVARALGISYGYLNQVTYGHAPLTPALRDRLAEYLGVPVAELFPR
ncbi:MAG: hypothetical protein C0498_01600 [Anaerolinea sp.]|nr:hypothetical protein [Anaerolinea sp.]